jgi:hypothetical protein
MKPSRDWAAILEDTITQSRGKLPKISQEKYWSPGLQRMSKMCGDQVGDKRKKRAN